MFTIRKTFIPRFHNSYRLNVLIFKTGTPTEVYYLVHPLLSLKIFHVSFLRAFIILSYSHHFVLSLGL
jgi:hypothetical protein